MDLVVFYSPEKACMTYYINNDAAGYKIEYPFSHIKNITLESGDQGPQPNGAPARPTGLVVELNRPPLFYMDSSNSGGFYQCGDFTEDQQASSTMIHRLGGHPKVLSVQLAKLVSLESFQNRLAYSNVPANGPMSPPFIQRPASQPNQFAPAFTGMYAENPSVSNLQGGRGHKRQRSRSVPVAVDFSALTAPMAPFTVPPPPQFNQAESNIYAPIPQPAQSLAPNLRIDTSSGYAFDPRSHPMSATTTASPSDFASPALFSAGPQGDSTPVGTMGPQFTLPYVSPAVDSGVGAQTASPYSNVSHADPMIANHSPPMANMSHPPQEIYGMGGEHHSSYAEEGLPLGNMYKPMNYSSVPTSMGLENGAFEMPMHSMSDQNSPGIQGDYQGVTLENVDPNVLSPSS